MKPIIKTIFSSLLITSLLLTCVSCASKGEKPIDTVADNIDTSDFKSIYFPEKGKSQSYGMADFDNSVFSATIPEMYGKVQAVILADVVEDGMTEGKEDDAFANVSVLHAWKGDVNVGDILNVHENGIKFEDGTDDSIGGEPLLRKDMRVILFLFTRTNGETYGIRGCFQGKFFLNNDGNVYSYEYFSDEYNIKLTDVHDCVSYEDFKAILDSLSDTVGEDNSETLSPDSDIAFPDKDAGKPNIIV